MRIAVVGDTHGNKAIVRQVAEQMERVDYLLFTGDFYGDGVYLKSLLQVPAKMVKGNCDFLSPALSEMKFELSGQRFWLLHGHHYGVKRGLTTLALAAEQKSVDIVVFGHTHVPADDTYQGRLYFNPGSPALPRFNSQPSYGIIEIKDQQIATQIITLK